LPQAKQVRWYQRVLAVLVVADGQPAADVAAMLGRSTRVVQLWMGRYLQQHRVQDLQDRRRSGRPPVSSAITDRRIVQEFEKDPLRLGYQATNWTVGLLAEHLGRRYGCPIRPRTLRRRLQALGLVWKRARHAYRDPEPHVAQKKGESCGV
jgi:transposase